LSLVREIFGLEARVQVSSYGQWMNIDVYSRVVAAWFHTHFGRGATGKSLPTWLLYAEDDIQAAFLVGVLRGDGMYFERRYPVGGKQREKVFRKFNITLANPSLVHQLWQIMLRLGYDANFRPVDTRYVTPHASKAAQVNLPPLSSRDLIQAAFGIPLPAPDQRYVRRHIRRDDEGSVFFKVAAIEVVPFDGVVYNLEVAEDHTYVTEGVVVHNCFVLPISDDMGRKESGIFMTLRNAALIQQTGGGNGFSFSRLRPRNTIVKSSAGKATGPVGFLRVYDKAFGEIAQGGTRRGANMAVLRVDHPDIEDFITCKTDENAITNFNISVAVTDAFMRAVENDEEWELVFPDVLAPEYETFDGTLEDAREQGVPIKAYRKVRARDLFDKIVRQAHHNGEPGLLFLDAANRDNPVPHQYRLEATNPCFVGDTRIATAEGLIPIREMAESGRLYTIVTDNRAPLGGVGQAGAQRGTRLRPQVRAFKTRADEPVYRLRTRQGYSVVATADHPFLTPDRGYVELQDLRPGDRILLQSGEGAWSEDDALPQVETVTAAMAEMALAGDWAGGQRVQRRDFAAQYANLPRRWSRELGLVLGVLIGDGWLSPSSHAMVGFTFSSPALQEEVHAALREWFGEGHLADRGSHIQLTYGRMPYEFFTALGVQPVRSPEKRVPEALWRAPRAAVVGFLQGLFSADGSVQVNPAKRDATVRLASSSPALLEDVQLLLLNFGIVSRLAKRRAAGSTLLPDGRGGMKAYATAAQYELIIGRENRDRFARLIGFADPEKQARLEAFIQSQVRGPYREPFEDTIVAIEPAGRADVYDLEEPETHSLIANGLVCHNCGEQWLGPYENCCLGSINLAQHATPEGGVDWEKLRRTVARAVRFLDDVVQANAYVPAVPQLKEAAHRNRRIGLGIKGLADLMYRNRVRYGSPEAQDFAAQIMEFIRYHAMRTSIELARERGPFPGIQGSIYDPENLKWKPPTWPDWLGGGPRLDLKRPKLNWKALVRDLKKHGIRNAAQMTVAPTGTISTVSGVEGYGCEPVFALAYYRYVNDEDGQRIRLRYVSPLFMQALDETDLDAETKEAVIQHVLEYGTIQNYPGDLPDWLRNTFVVAQDVAAEEHVRMQAALQVFVDNAISKCVVGDTLVLTAQGLAPIASLGDLRLPDQFAPLGRDIVSPAGVEPASEFYYGGWRETRKVALRYGFQIEGTPNHRVHVLDAAGQVVFRRLDELKPGDMVVLYAGQRRFGPAGGSLPRFSGVFRTNSRRIRFPERMSEDLAFLLGAIVAEGAITINGVNISNTDRALLERLQGLAQQFFGIPGYIARDKRNQVLYLQLNSRALRHWLVADLGIEPGAANKAIPAAILQAAEDELAAFLRGLFLDAYMTQDGRTFGITLASERLIRQLQVLLLNGGVVATVRQTAERAWNLTVQGQELENLAAWLGFVESWKNERLARRNQGRLRLPRNYSRLLPEAVTRALREMMQQPEISLRRGFAVDTAAGRQAYQRARVNLRAGHRLTRRDARQIYETLRRQGARHPFADAFFAQDHDGKLYVPVERVEVSFAEVFDISVPGSHTFVANGLGNHNTINFPATATPDDVAEAFMLAWKLGVKGLTVYVTGSRETVVLETKATAKEKGKAVEGESPSTPVAASASEERAPAATAPAPRGALSPTMEEETVTQPQLWPEFKKPRPEVLKGFTFQVNTPLGKAFVTINENGGDQPFEVFINTAKAGSETAAISEAIGRLISYILRLSSPVNPIERLEEVIRQLRGIGGDRPLGFGPYRIRSLPDGVGYALEKYLLSYRERMGLTSDDGGSAAAAVSVASQLPLLQGAPEPNGDAPQAAQDMTKVFVEGAQLCPECGQATLVLEEGCAKCYSCGYSEC
ncbi:MAG: hypothetical protein GXO37_05685, partial [Chloroflexi bacterium]|nr:hypothetical protein [Chloroflexota bacterium]